MSKLVEGDIHQSAANASPPDIRVYVDRRKLRHVVTGVLVPARSRYSTEPDHGAITLRNEHRRRRFAASQRLAPTTRTTIIAPRSRVDLDDHQQLGSSVRWWGPAQLRMRD